MQSCPSQALTRASDSSCARFETPNAVIRAQFLICIISLIQREKINGWGEVRSNSLVSMEVDIGTDREDICSRLRQQRGKILALVRDSYSNALNQGLYLTG